MDNRKTEISGAEFYELPADSYELMDIRGEESYQYGTIPGALCVPQDELDERMKQLPEGKKAILFCTKGHLSEEEAERLSEEGYPVYSLAGGYMQWLRDSFARQEAEQQLSERTKEIEMSLRKQFHRPLVSRFAKALNRYELLSPGDKVAVCISGGKDSMLMAKLFQEIKRHNKFDFELVFLVMDPGYSAMNREVIENNAKLLGIPITIFETNIFDAVVNVEKSPCYLCARMRRGYLYSKAQELGCNKIALGHHYDDVIETILMGMMYGAQIQTMMPKLHSTNFEGMELIRPMYLIREDDIKRWRDVNGLHFIQCACRFTDTCSTVQDDGSTNSKRMEMKMLIRKLKETNPHIESNIFNSVENVNLDTVIAYKQKGEKHSFLDTY